MSECTGHARWHLPVVVNHPRADRNRSTRPEKSHPGHAWSVFVTEQHRPRHPPWGGMGVGRGRGEGKCRCSSRWHGLLVVGLDTPGRPQHSTRREPTGPLGCGCAGTASCRHTIGCVVDVHMQGAADFGCPATSLLSRQPSVPPWLVPDCMLCVLLRSFFFGCCCAPVIDVPLGMVVVVRGCCY